MKVELDTLNTWARLSEDTNRHLLRTLDALRIGSLTPEKAQEAIEAAGAAQHTNNRLFQALLRAGADDPRHYAPVYREREASVTLEQLESTANRRLASLLREAAEAAVEVERERGRDSQAARRIVAIRPIH